MSDVGGGQDLMLRCPACARSFPVTVPPPSSPSNDLTVICGACQHRLTTDELLDAMAASLKNLLAQAQSRFASGAAKKS